MGRWPSAGVSGLEVVVLLIYWGAAGAGCVIQVWWPCEGNDLRWWFCKIV